MNKACDSKKIIVIIGDSLGAPRPWVGVYFKRTYAFQLDALLNNDYFVANYAVGGNTSSKCVKESFLRTNIKNSDISFAIIQLGIVDCAPRLLSNFDRILGGLSSRNRFFEPLFKNYVKIKSRHRYWFTKNFPKTLVPLHVFRSNYRRLIDEVISTNPVKKIFLIEVAYPGVSLIEKSFNIVGNINAYNNVLHQIALENPDIIEIIRIYEKTKIESSWIAADDGHHILPEAHDWIAIQLYDRIKLALKSLRES